LLQRVPWLCAAREVEGGADDGGAGLVTDSERRAEIGPDVWPGISFRPFPPAWLVVFVHRAFAIAHSFEAAGAELKSVVGRF
jgi:hypothetical protein